MVFLLLTYMFILSSVYLTIDAQSWGNPHLAKSLVGLLVSGSYIAGYAKWLFWFQGPVVWHSVVLDYANWMLAYFIVDGTLLLYSPFQRPDSYNFVIHHIISMKLIQAHVDSVFPVSIGIQFLALFELSNFFVQLFQMCHWQDWVTAKHVILYPFIAVYVPIRMFVIPYYSYLHYLPFIRNMQWGQCIYYGAMLLFVNMFSITYAYVVSNKFIQHMLSVD
jgi:hypothetical protein